MKNIYNKIITFVFAGFISLTLIFSLIFGYDDIVGTLVENKDKLTDIRLSSAYFKDVVDCIDTAYTRGVFMRDRYVDLYGGLQRLTGKEVLWDSNPNKTIVIGNDGKLYSAGNITMNNADYTVNNKHLDNFANKLIDLGSFLQNKGAELVFFQAPARYDPDYVKLPISISDEDKKNVDYLYDKLCGQQHLTVLNSQYLYKEQSIDFNDLFFKTDHHWTIKTAFWAYGEICKKLNEKGFAIDESYFDLRNYNIETVKNSYLGSLGATTGGLFVGYDDFDFIYPKFETHFVKTICRTQNQSIAQGGEIKYEGSFLESVISNYYSIKDHRANITFGSYVSSDRSEIIIENSGSATSKKILILKDSFGLPVSAFLSTCFAEERILDLRYYKDSTVYQYIEEYKPDAVIIIYNPGAYSDTFFNFN